MEQKDRSFLTCVLHGFCVLFAQIIVASILLLWTLQFVALMYGVRIDGAAVLEHLVLSLAFLALFPGQRVWTVQVPGPSGRLVTIVGNETAQNGV